MQFVLRKVQLGLKPSLCARPSIVRQRKTRKCCTHHRSYQLLKKPVCFLFRHSHIRLCNRHHQFLYMKEYKEQHHLTHYIPSALTYSIKQLPATAIFQEDVVNGAFAPVPIEAHYVGVR